MILVLTYAICWAPMNIHNVLNGFEVISYSQYSVANDKGDKERVWAILPCQCSKKNIGKIIVYLCTTTDAVVRVASESEYKRQATRGYAINGDTADFAKFHGFIAAVGEKFAVICK
ncbi:hypothetical protein ANCCEY_00484 [Ancylostoma ceylanicum]|uniref:Uncharacterized protein n=1 Tax=Ancylostoma ceylanicum TaxID=53326 RepID=A0A0D6MDB8_9BILA|nr:hypothetical protein ANCCEY_00484 [Ancylostoma ceylanicum]